MSIQSDMVKLQIFVANRKLNALENFVFVGDRDQRNVQASTGLLLARMLNAELAGLEKLLEGENLVQMLRKNNGN